MLRWSDVNPQDGVFDWSELRRALAKGNGVYLRLENSHVIHCPPWLEAKYPDLKQGILHGGQSSDNWEVLTGGTYYPMWHDGFAAEFHRLLRSLQESGLTQHENFRFWYIPGGWAWGEFGVGFVKGLKQAGMGPEDFLRWWQSTLDAYVEAVGTANTGKFMFTGQDHVALCDGDQEWRRVTGRRVFAEAMQRGCGTRFGLLEKFDFLTGDMPAYGLPVIKLGGANYQVAEETSPLLADSSRWIGSENEESASTTVVSTT